MRNYGRIHFLWLLQLPKIVGYRVNEMLALQGEITEQREALP